MTDINALKEALSKFADLCPWLEQKQETDTSGVILGTFDEEVLLIGEGYNSPDCVTAGMIRQARRVLGTTS